MGYKVVVPGADFSGFGLKTTEPIKGFFATVGANNTEKGLYNAFYQSLVDADAWAALDAFYPFHGATAALQKWNFRNYLKYPLSFISDNSAYHTSNGYDLTTFATTTSPAYAITGYRPPIGNLAPFAFGALHTNSYSTSIQKKLMSMSGGTGGADFLVGRTIGTPVTAGKIGDYVVQFPDYNRAIKGPLSVIRGASETSLVDDATVIAAISNPAAAYAADGGFMTINSDGGGVIAASWICNNNITLTKLFSIIQQAKILAAGLGRTYSN